MTENRPPSGGVGQFINRHIAQIARKRMTQVMNTHSHSDHHLGNIAFAESTVIGSERCRELVVENRDEWAYLMERLAGCSFPNTQPVSAGTVYPALSKTSIRLNGMGLMLRVLSDSHTTTNLMVYLPDDTV